MRTFPKHLSGQTKFAQNTQKYISRHESKKFPAIWGATSKFQAPDGWHEASSLLKTRKSVKSPQDLSYLELSARCMCTDTHFCVYRKISNNSAENMWRHQTELGRAVDLASGICAPLFYIQYSFFLNSYFSEIIKQKRAKEPILFPKLLM